MSRRAQDAPAFRVMAGQRWVNRRGDAVDRCIVAWRAGEQHSTGETVWMCATDDGLRQRWESQIRREELDESDPATIGTVEAMVREAWARLHPRAHVDIRRTGSGWEVVVCDLGATFGYDHAPTRHEAWAAALHAAPTQETDR